VEGANILTRSLIIFGQGAVRAHPYVLKEIQAAHEQDSKKAVLNFDEAFFGHISFSLSNAVRSWMYALSSGRLIHVPTENPTHRYYQLLTRYASSFAFASDIAMLSLGGALKRREKLSARLGDVLSQLYICSATMKKFEDDGRPEEDLPLLDWAMEDGLYRIQVAFDGVLQNFPNRFFAILMRALIFPLGQCRRPPSDALGNQVSSILMQPGAARDRLTAGMFISTDEADAIGALEASLASTLTCEPIQAELEKARKEKKLKAKDELALITEARDKGIITADQAQQLERDYALRRKVIMVDDFATEELRACTA